MTITLYDIPSSIPGNVFSPNTGKTRLALIFKGIPFKTEWVEFSDIEKKMKELGVGPTETWPDGSPRYAVPAIHDPSTGKIIGDSMKIAEYLDDTYPDKPTLFPFGARAPIRLFDEFFFPTAVKPAGLVLSMETFFKLNAPSQEYFRRTRERILGMKMEELAPPGEKRDGYLAASKEGFSKVAKILSENGDGTLPFFYGETPSHADLIIVAHLLWFKIVLGADNPEWKAMEEWDGGRWAKLLELTKKYHAVNA